MLNELLAEETGILSLVAVAGADVVGHVIFTDCAIDGVSARVALLGPLLVTPDRQRQGIGGRLVRDGFRRLEQAGTGWVYVLGDPAYYSRLGFQAEDDVAPPYSVPADELPVEWQGAWQSVSLRDDGKPPQGRLLVPQPWRQEAMWLP